MDTTDKKQLKEILAHIENHLPGWTGFIEAEYLVNSNFRALCADYLVCALAKENWEWSEAPVAAERRREYAQLLDELLQDIKDWLQMSNNPSKAS